MRTRDGTRTKPPVFGFRVPPSDCERPRRPGSGGGSGGAGGTHPDPIAPADLSGLSIAVVTGGTATALVLGPEGEIDAARARVHPRLEGGGVAFIGPRSSTASGVSSRSVSDSGDSTGVVTDIVTDA